MSNLYPDGLIESEETLKAEQSLLGAIFLEPSAFDEVQTVIDETDFRSERHNFIFRAMRYINKEKGVIEPLTMVSMLNSFKRLDQAGGITYLNELHGSAYTAANILQYAKIVKHFSLKRKGIQLAEDIRSVVIEDEFETADDFFQIIDTMTTQIRPKRNNRMQTFAETEQDFEHFMNTREDLIKTGFNQFDNNFGGVGRGWLYILAGRPSVGKTAKSLQMAMNFAHQNAGEILYWSQEMTFNQLKQRMLSNITGVSYGQIRQKILSDGDKNIVMDAHRKTANLPIHVEDSIGVTIDHIRTTAKIMKRKHDKIGAIFVDYLTRMNIKQEKNQTWSRAVGEVAKRFKWLAQEMECPVILLAQLNREGADGAPGLHHLRDSGEIEQEADVVEFLWREDEKDDPKGIIVNSTIAKGRDIGLSTMKYRFKGWIQRYEDYLEEKSYDPNAEGFVSHAKNQRRRGKPA